MLCWFSGDAPEMEPDFKYVGSSGMGIAVHRHAMLDERDNAIAAGAWLFDNTQKSAECAGGAEATLPPGTVTLTRSARPALRG